MLEVEVHPDQAMDENQDKHGPEGRGIRRLASESTPVKNSFHLRWERVQAMKQKPRKKKRTMMSKMTLNLCYIRPNTTQRRSVEKVHIKDWQASVTLILLVFHGLDLAS